MELFLMRHADAGRPDPLRYPDDHQRPLSERGNREHRRLARALMPVLQPLDRILSSPLLRARQTADLVAEALQCPARVEETAILGSECTVGRFIGLLENHPRDARMLCVGHEPAMSRLAAVFLDGDGLSTIAFVPGSVLGLTFAGHPAPGRGTLRLFLRPPELLTLVQEAAQH
jgi:phosphohistidine phosphatase